MWMWRGGGRGGVGAGCSRVVECGELAVWMSEWEGHGGAGVMMLRAAAKSCCPKDRSKQARLCGAGKGERSWPYVYVGNSIGWN